MSGHSKWSQIKRAKGAADNARGKLFTKIGKEISVAVKMGGADIMANSRLREVIAKAKSNNMPNDNISRCIKKATGEDAQKNYEEIVYEGYAAGGVAVMVEALTDNKNRTAGEVRNAFEKYGGSLGVSGAVAFMFDRFGVVNINPADATKAYNLTPAEIAEAQDKLFETLIETPLVDIALDEDLLVVTCEPAGLGAVCDCLEKAGVKTDSANVEWVANNYVALPEDKQISFTKMLDMLDDNDDVQSVYHNAE